VQVDSLRFDAGSLSLNLVATLGRRFGDPVERLPSVERLREWLRAAGLDAEVTGADLARVRRLRESLDELFRAALIGTRPPAGALADVNGAAASSAPRLDGLALAGDGLDPVLALIAADAIRVVAGADRADLRACDADDCRMLYLSRGRRARRWCSSERCGNRLRVAAHRARTAA
jgi:predicted RNA-binding Zn ribbon-like protein